MSDLVTDLLRPEAYPGEPPQKVELKGTHASWVFLTEREVWKVKRPVNLGFLDYSTPEARRWCCEEELRLGTRFAPGAYLGVEPIHYDKGGHTFRAPDTGARAVVDWAVRMRRLPEAWTAAALLQAGRLGTAHLAALGARLAALYDEAPVRPEFGAPAVLAANVAENHEEMRPFEGRFVSRDTLERLLGWQEGVLASEAATLDRRLTDERIREGHGDLRLEHVYFERMRIDSPLVLDALEFAPRFRCQDVGLDVAFLAMDMDAHGRPDLGSFFLSRFAREADDYGFYPLLDFYLCYRACVRAKVACLVAQDESLPRDRAREKAEEAARLFSLAVSYTHAERACPIVLVVGGTPGVGKTTIAEALGQRLAAPVISSDAVRKHLGGVPLYQRAPAALYSEGMSRETLAGVMGRAQEVLDARRPVILDATFRDEASRAGARTLARRNGCPFMFVELTCDEGTARARIIERAREGTISDADATVLADMRRAYKPPRELPPSERISLDARPAVPDIVAAALRALPPSAHRPPRHS